MRDASHRRRLGPLPTILGIVVLAATVALFAGQLLGYRVHAITTGSMTGTADAGSMVVSHFEPTSDLQVGDVITYMPPPDAPIETVVTHRIADITTNDDGTLAYSTRGDANETVDPWTFQLTDDQQMVMQAAVPHLGRPVLLLSDPGTRRIVIGGPALVIAALALLDIIRIWRDRDEQDEATDGLPGVAAVLAAIRAIAPVPPPVGVVVERPNAPARHSQPRVVVARPVTRVLDLTQFPADSTPPLVTHVAEATPAVRRRVVTRRVAVAATGDTPTPSSTDRPARPVVVVRAADRRPSATDVR